MLGNVDYKVKGFLFLVIFLSGCAASLTPIPDLSSLGAKTYIKQCGSCHSVPHPKRHELSAWRHILDLMDKRIKERGMPEISEQDKQVVFHYLQAHAKQ